MFGSLRSRLVIVIGAMQVVTWLAILSVGGVYLWNELEESYNVELIQFASAITGVFDAVEKHSPATGGEEVIASSSRHIDEKQLPAGISADDVRDHLVQVSSGGRILFRTPTAPTTALKVPHGINDLTFAGVTWKTLGQTDPVNGNHVVVAIRRYEVNTTIIAALVSLLVPLAGAGLVSTLLTSILVTRLLKPLEGWARHIGDMSPYDTGPIDDREALREVRPVLSALNRMMDRVRASIKFERQFVRDAAHELRTPLTAIRAQIEGGDWNGLSSEQEMRMHKVLFGLRRASRLVNQLMDLARSEEPRTPSLESRLDVADVVGAKLTELINSGSISDPRRLSFTAPDDPIWLTCAPSDLEIVLSNLVDNAVKYAGEKAEIAVTLARQDDHFVLSVEDDGPGIPAGKREEVFNRFVRLASSSTYGSGLGLALVKEIVTQLGGEVKLGSSKRLNGLIVTARLPVEAEADASSDGALRAAG